MPKSRDAIIILRTAEMQIAEDWSGFAYIIDGAGKLGGTKGSREQALVLGKGDEIIASTDDAEGFRSDLMDQNLKTRFYPFYIGVSSHGYLRSSTEKAASLHTRMLLYTMLLPLTADLSIFFLGRFKFCAVLQCVICLEEAIFAGSY